jgi:hypothetical protein
MNEKPMPVTLVNTRVVRKIEERALSFLPIKNPNMIINPEPIAIRLINGSMTARRHRLPGTRRAS